MYRFVFKMFDRSFERVPAEFAYFPIAIERSRRARDEDDDAEKAASWIEARAIDWRVGGEEWEYTLS